MKSEGLGDLPLTILLIHLIDLLYFIMLTINFNFNLKLQHQNNKSLPFNSFDSLLQNVENLIKLTILIYLLRPVLYLKLRNRRHVHIRLIEARTYDNHLGGASVQV